MYIFYLIIFLAIIIWSLWIQYFAPKKIISSEFKFDNLSYEHFIALATYTAEEMNWGLVYLDNTQIKYVTNKSLFSYGELVTLQQSDIDTATITSMYLYTKTGITNRLATIERKFIEMFKKNQRELSKEELDNLFEAVLDVYEDFYNEHYKDEEEWTEV